MRQASGPRAALLFSLAIMIPSLGIAQANPTVLVVDQSFTTPTAPEFTTIKGALNYIESVNWPCPTSSHPECLPYEVIVHPGNYREKLLLRHENVTLEGVSRDEVRILFDPNDSSPGPSIVQAGGITLRHLTFVGPDTGSSSTDSEGLELQLGVNSADNILMENCRVQSARRGVMVITTAYTGDRNDNIVFSNNVIEVSLSGIEIRPFGYATNFIPGIIDFTSRGNQIITRNKADWEAPAAIKIGGLEPSSVFRSIGDTFDEQSDHNSGDGDLNGFVFADSMPRYSEIVGTHMRLVHLGGRNPDFAEGFAGVKIHAQSTPNQVPAIGEMQVVACSGLEIYIEDNSTGAPGGGNAYQVAGARVDVLVSGGTVTWKIADPEHFTRTTFSVVGGADDPTFATGTPHGIFYIGVPVDEISIGTGGGDGTATPFDQGKVKATRGLVGATQTVQIDDIAQHLASNLELHASSDETITGAWTHTGNLSLQGEGSQSPYLDLGASSATWNIFAHNGGGLLEISSSDSAPVEMEFFNRGTGNINLRIGKGVFAPIDDSTSNLGVEGLRWRDVRGRSGYFDASLEIPRSSSQPTLTDNQTAIDDSTSAGPRLCVGARGHTWCGPVMTCVDSSGCP